MAAWREKVASGARWRACDGRAAIAAWRGSGQSLAAFARDNEVDPQRLGWWRKRIEGIEAPASSLVPVTVKGAVFAALDAAVRVAIDGAVIEVVDPQRASAAWVAELVARALGGRA